MGTTLPPDSSSSIGSSRRGTSYWKIDADDTNFGRPTAGVVPNTPGGVIHVTSKHIYVFYRKTALTRIVKGFVDTAHYIVEGACADEHYLAAGPGCGAGAGVAVTSGGVVCSSRNWKTPGWPKPGTLPGIAGVVSTFGASSSIRLSRRRTSAGTTLRWSSSTW